MFCYFSITISSSSSVVIRTGELSEHHIYNNHRVCDLFWNIFIPVLSRQQEKIQSTWDSKSIRRELLSLISSFGVGEIVYLAVRWPTLYYFLEIRYRGILGITCFRNYCNCILHDYSDHISKKD